MPYNEKTITPELLKKYISNSLPDFTTKIVSEKDYNIYVQNKDDKDINKVLIFTRRATITPTIKSISAEFRDKLRISVINIPEGKENDFQKELIKDYEIESFPKLIVEETYDAKTNEILGQYRIHDFKQSDFKIDSLQRFLYPFARLTPKEELDDISENREQHFSD